MNNENANNLINDLFNEYLQSGGKPQVTSFRFFVEHLIKQNIKQKCGGSSRRMAPGSHDWRHQLKAQFGGRGAKWCWVDLEVIEPHLKRLEAEGVDTSSYRSHINRNGRAWIRYQKPRIINGINSACFEIRTWCSTIDQPDQWMSIPMSELDLVEQMLTTPYALKLEEGEVVEQKDSGSNELDLDDLI